MWGTVVQLRVKVFLGWLLNHSLSLFVCFGLFNPILSALIIFPSSSKRRFYRLYQKHTAVLVRPPASLRNGLEILTPIFIYSQQVQGYGMLDQVPAFYLLWWNHPDIARNTIGAILGGPPNPGLALLKNGWQSLWLKMKATWWERKTISPGSTASIVDLSLFFLCPKYPKMGWWENLRHPCLQKEQVLFHLIFDRYFPTQPTDLL